MYQKDYILRMVQMMAELIAGLLGLIRKGDYAIAEQKIDHTYYDMLKKDAAFFRGIKKEELTTKLLEEHNFSNGHLEILSGLFYAEGELRQARKQTTESLEFYEKSLLLLQYVIETSRAFSIEHQKQEMLLKEKIETIRSIR